MGGRLVAGEVVFPVQGEGDDVAAARAQGGAAISLMDIEIHDQHPLAESLVQAGSCRDHQIVEEAEAAAKPPVGVVVAAGDLQSAALRKGVAAGGQGGADRVQGTFNQQGRPGKAEPANGPFIEGAGEGGLYIGRIVHLLYLLTVGRGGLCQRIVEGDEAFKQRLVLGQGEAVTLGQPQGGVVGVIEDAQ